MSGITKKQAHMLAAYGYQLICNAGTVFDITEIKQSCIVADCELGYSQDIEINFDEVGTKYRVICLPYEALTKEVNGVVPIFELAKLAKPSAKKWYLGDGISAISEDHYFKLDFSHGLFNLTNTSYDSIEFDYNTVADAYYSMHFPPHGIPTECLKFKELTALATEGNKK